MAGSARGADRTPQRGVPTPIKAQVSTCAFLFLLAINPDFSNLFRKEIIS